MVDITVNEIERVAIGAIRRDEKNVKRHPEAQVRQIMASIERFGFNDPIAVDMDMVIAEGHGRLEAAERLGMTHVNIIRLPFASERERRAYAIAHNQTQHLSPMDNQAVLDEFEALAVTTGDYEAVGFTNEDVTFMAYEHAGSPGGAPAGASPGAQAATARYANNAVVKSVLKFDTQDQLMNWYTFLDWLRTRYADEQTLSDRLAAYVRDYGHDHG